MTALLMMNYTNIVVYHMSSTLMMHCSNISSQQLCLFSVSLIYVKSKILLKAKSLSPVWLSICLFGEGGNSLKKGMTLLVTIKNAKDYKNNRYFVLAFNICISTLCFKKLEHILCNEILFCIDRTEFYVHCIYNRKHWIRLKRETI